MTTEILFFENHAENEAGRLVPVLFLFLFFNKSKKQMACSLVSILFESPQLGKQLNKIYKTLEY